MWIAWILYVSLRWLVGSLCVVLETHQKRLLTVYMCSVSYARARLCVCVCTMESDTVNG